MLNIVEAILKLTSLSVNFKCKNEEPEAIKTLMHEEKQLQKHCRISLAQGEVNKQIYRKFRVQKSL